MLTIQILGIGCKKSRALKANLQAALDMLSVSVSIEEIVAVEDIIQYPISATPALLIGDKVVTEGYVPPVRELQNILAGHYRSNITMKNILVPTDFSNTAGNAFRFALDLIGDQENDLTVLHVYHPYFDPDNPLDGSKNKEQEAATMKRMEAFIGENTSPSTPEGKDIDLDNINLRKKITYGFAADEIVAKSENFDLVVMGTTGDGDLIEHWFGSVSSHVAQHANCPVLLVPEGTKFHGFKTVVYATDNEAIDKVFFQRVSRDLGLGHADTHFVNVQKRSDEAFAFTKVKQERIQESAQSEIELTTAEVASNDVLKALNEYATAHRANLLIMRTKQRSFLEKIFHASLTKKMVLQAKMPILVLHSQG